MALFGKPYKYSFNCVKHDLQGSGAWCPRCEPEREADQASRIQSILNGATPRTMEEPEVGGTKFDQGKPRMDLLDPLWMEETAKVLGFGAQKYAAHNWRAGIAQSRLIGAAMRHLMAHQRGEDKDPESGLPHLAHASCCLMFLTNMAATRPDLDDRYKG